jgi:nitrogen regulatory protein PII
MLARSATDSYPCEQQDRRDRGKQQIAPSTETAQHKMGVTVMKQITAVLENTTMDDIQAALPAVTEWSTTVSPVRQYMGRDVATHVYRGVRYTTRYTDRVRLDIQVDDNSVDAVIDWMTSAAEAGLIGPSRVSITSADAVLDIRAGQSTRKLARVA